MTGRLVLSKFSIGVGDRFAHQAEAQLRACMMAAEQGVEVVPVWNKSNREHNIVGSEPASVRAAADAAVRALGWKQPYHVDADHINLATVDRFLEASDFFTLDVADAIGKPADRRATLRLRGATPSWPAASRSPGSTRRSKSPRETVARIAAKYLLAVQEAGRIYRHIEARQGRGHFVTEVSMDETDCPQTPAELLVILAALADEGIPVQTIAPKFTGRFNKGVDYVGDAAQFEREFQRRPRRDRATPSARYGLPANLKLSVHSGSDKFSIYAGHPPRAARLRRRRAPQDRRHHLARGTDRPRRSRRRRPRARQGDLRRRLRAPRRAVRALRHRHRHRPGAAARARRGERLDGRAVRRRPAPRSAPRAASTPTSGSSCTSATRWPRRWATATCARSRAVSATSSPQRHRTTSSSATSEALFSAVKTWTTMPFIHEDFLLTNATARRLYHEYAEGRADSRLPLPPAAAGRRREPALRATCSRSGSRATTTSGAPCAPTASPSASAPATPTPVREVPGLGAHRAAHAAQPALPLDAPGAEALLRHRRTARREHRAARSGSAPTRCWPGDDLRAHGILRKFHVKAVCTTDDPDRRPRRTTSAIAASGLATQRASRPSGPTRRSTSTSRKPFNPWVDRLAAAANIEITQLRRASSTRCSKRHDFFHADGRPALRPRPEPLLRRFLHRGRGGADLRPGARRARPPRPKSRRSSPRS